MTKRLRPLILTLFSVSLFCVPAFADEWTFLNEKTHTSADRTIIVQFKFGVFTPLDQDCLQSLWFILQERMETGLKEWATRGIEFSFTAEQGALDISVHGSTGHEVHALTEVVTHIRTMEPTADSIERYQKYWAQAVANMEALSPGNAVLDLVEDLFAPRNTGLLAQKNIAGHLNVHVLADFLNRTIRASNKLIVVSGDSDSTEIEGLRDAMKFVSPDGLPAHHNVDRRRIQTTLQYEEPWLDKERSGVGVARVLPGAVMEDFQGRAALSVLTRVLTQRIFEHNHRLGDIQGIRQIQTGPLESHIVIYGEAPDISSVARIQRSWQKQLQDLRSHKVTSNEMEEARSRMLALISQPPASSQESADRLMRSWLATGTRDYSQSIQRALRNLTTDAVYAEAERFFSEDRPEMTVIKGVGESEGCSRLLLARYGVQFQLSMPHEE